MRRKTRRLQQGSGTFELGLLVEVVDVDGHVRLNAVRFTAAAGPRLAAHIVVEHAPPLWSLLLSLASSLLSALDSVWAFPVPS
jgi:hypothetical protein